MILTTFSQHETSNGRTMANIIIQQLRQNGYRAIFCMFIFIVSFSYSNGSLKSKPVLSAVIPGRFLFGGLFPVHQNALEGTCNLINPSRGIQRLEAMLYTLDEINSDHSILPGINIGAEIFDTCARETIALDRSLEFIRGTFTSLDAFEFRCDDGSVAKAKKTPKAIAGVIGGSSNWCSQLVKVV